MSEEQSTSPISPSLSAIRKKWEQPDHTLGINIAWKSVRSLPPRFSTDTLAPNSSQTRLQHSSRDCVVWVFSFPSLPPQPGVPAADRAAAINAWRQLKGAKNGVGRQQGAAGPTKP